MSALGQATTPLGARMRALRRARALSQEELGRRIGTTATSIARWEQGHVMPQVALFAPLARALGVSMDALYWGAETQKLPAQDGPGVM